MLIFTYIIFVLFIIVILGAKENEIEFSEFELNRRIDSGDNRASKMLAKKQLIPIMNRIRHFIVMFLAIVVISIVSSLFVLYQAILISVVTFIVIAMILKTKVLDSVSIYINKKTLPFIYRLYNASTEKNKKRIIRFFGRKKQPWSFYSKEELLFFLEKHHQVLSDSERIWIERILKISQKDSILDIALDDQKIAILHSNDILTPLVIDELFKTKQQYFVVMDEQEIEVRGIVAIEDIVAITGEDSKKAKEVMRSNFLEIKSDKKCLDVLEKMLAKNSNFAVITRKNGDLAGVVHINNFLKNI